MRKKLLRSRSGFEKPESREEAIMQNILGASNVLEPSESNIEEILKSILYNTPYTKEAEFEIEKILLAIKNNGTYDGECESRDLKILFAILNDLDYTEEAESRIEELFIEWLNQRSKVKVLEGIPPLTFVAKGEPLINYEISGNMIQSGTPTPDNPIMPQGTGERTENLLHEFYAASGEISGNSYTITKNSIETHNDGSVLGAWYVLAEFKRNGNYANYTLIDEKHSFKIPAGTYTFSANENIHSANNGLRLIVGQLGQTVAGATGGAKNIGVGQTFTVDADSYVCPVLEIRNDSRVDEYILANPMLNSGSTALPYEPYGIKIPILSANTTTPVYLGEVQTTRRVKKLVLTGEEKWEKSKAYQGSFYAPIVTDILSEAYTAYCSHLAFSTLSLYAKGKFCFNGGDIKNCNLWFNQFSSNTTVEEFKSYLAAQYAAGTPVTVWYVLANEETGIVNEPLMKIGEYADSISKAQAGVEIPTVNGSNTLDVDTTLKPSNIYIEYK